MDERARQTLETILRMCEELFSFDTDSEGQIVIYTGLYRRKGILEDFEASNDSDLEG